MLLLTLLLLPLVCGVDVTTSGRFSNCVPPGAGCTFSLVNTTEGMEHQVRWAKSTGLGRSGLGYIGLSTNFTFQPLEEAQLIGILRHYNWPVTGQVPETVDLTLNLSSVDLLISIDFTLDIHETPNQVTPLDNGTCSYPEWIPGNLCCPYITPTTPCSDRIRFITPVNLNRSSAIGFTLKVEGFFDDGQIIDIFITQEKETSNGLLYGRIVQTCNSVCQSEDPCIQGECVNGICEFTPQGCDCLDECFICTEQDCFWCGDSCMESQEERCSATCSSDDDEDDSGTIAGIVVATTACCCMLALLALGVLGALCIAFTPQVKRLFYASGVKGANPTLRDVHLNPLHQPKHEVHVNPIAE